MTRGYRWRVAAVVSLGLFMAILDNTIVSVTLPQMQKAFHTDFETITWVASAYFLAQAAVIPVVGYLSDRIGSKLVFLTALMLFTAGSALCALAPTKETLIIFRVFQGIGGGALLPIAFSIIFRIFPPTERGMANAVLGIPVMMAPAFGPTIGGYLSTSFSWNAIFSINIPIGIVALILAILMLPGRAADFENQGEAVGKSRFDILGLVLSMIGFTALVYGITEAGSKGWGDPTVLTFIVVGAVVLATFIVIELRVSDPVMDLRLFANYTFTISNIVVWIVAAVLFGSLFLLPLFFENIQGATALVAGELLISQGLAMGVGMALSGALYNRVGPRILAASGLALLVIGTYSLTQLDVNTSGVSLQVWLVLRGLGLGFTMPPLQTVALSAVSNRAMAKASSLVTVTRMVASAIGVAGLTTYLTQQGANYALNIQAAMQTGSLSHQFSNIGAACASASNQAILHACVAQHASTLGLNDTFLVVVIFCAASIVLALIVGRDPSLLALKEAKARGEDFVLEREPILTD
ncbi:DHA2 family efflux MFS transporter permease subunit [Reticulibacter mediterranei]|uniref:DHA2 family efflux MFS transporter permease subunit n=1 Tax=Reticulibacter mediterranei TaxID=2778369 RepID=UPI001C69356F|nr:DHA2 family efflux MFS transporter permease subunit [Reticulibacter mediterranei]